MRERNSARKNMVRGLKAEGRIKSKKVEEAFMEVERERFLPPGLRNQAYVDRPLPVGNGQTISAPHMIAIMTEELMLKEGNRVLEIGGGSGYHAAITSRLVGGTGKVISVETVPQLVQKARRSLQSSGIENVDVIHYDGSRGYPPEAPYDRIYYTCAAPYIPDIVMDQLAEGGIMLSVEGASYSAQKLIRYTKEREGNIRKEFLTSCVFVPLVGQEGQ